MNATVVVVIPIYKPLINKNEEISLRQCFEVLGKHPIVFIKPDGLDTSQYESIIGADSFKVESFPAEFFQDIRGYNRLMLAQSFYGRFLQYRYMLIYQLDAFVFKDDLLYWCNQGYDYIGAPWINRQKWTRAVRSFFHHKFNLKQKNSNSPTWMQFYNRVGNGGFSLRHIQKFFEICETHKETIDFYNEHNDNHFFNEDVFWSVEVNRKKKRLNIPGFKKALHFSIEQKPDLGLSMIKGSLPFGMHAWHHYLPVWQRLIFAAQQNRATI